MATLICYTCKKEKSTETDFYTSGLKNCKECVKKKVREREEILRKNPEWVEKQKERHREKYYRLNYKEKHKPTPEKKKEIIDRFKANHPEKEKIRKASSGLKPKVKGNHLHHWNYNIEFAKDVIELSEKDHAKIHRFIKYDKKTFMYKDLSGNLLDTREKHEDLISKVLSNF